MSTPNSSPVSEEKKEDSVKTPKFTGGKMSHVLQFQEGTQLYDENGIFASPEAKEAFEQGIFYLKIDGSNYCFVKQPDGTWWPYARFDERASKPLPEGHGMLDLVQGGNPSEYGTHHYHYNKLSLDASAPGMGKKQVKINLVLVEFAKNNKAYLDSFGMDRITFEAVGSKFNQTPGVTSDVGVAIHLEQNLSDDTFPRTFEGIRDWLLSDAVCCEGVVVEHKGVYWKIRAGCFVKKCSFEVMKKAWSAAIKSKNNDDLDRMALEMFPRVVLMQMSDNCDEWV